MNTTPFKALRSAMSAAAQAEVMDRSAAILAGHHPNCCLANGCHNCCSHFCLDAEMCLCGKICLGAEVSQ